MQVFGIQPLLPATIYFWVLCIFRRLWQHVSDLSRLSVLAEHVMARFLLLNSSSSVQFPLNQSLCFLSAMPSFFFDILYTIDLMAFHLSSSVLAGISACLSFSEACRTSMTLWILILLIAKFLIGILSFPILRLTHYLVVNWPWHGQ